MNRPPRIGMRIIKSAVAVFLCFALSLVRRRFFPLLGEGVPFYSAIAAILCMQPYVSNSVKTALNRVVGTVIGGAGGTLFLLLERGTDLYRLPVLQYLLLSLCIIPLIYITVLVKKTTASYITCVVFLSITVSHALDVNPYLFALNRMADTLIGILISLLVNACRLPRKRGTGLLFLCGLEGVLCPQGEPASAYTRIRLNQLVGRGALISVCTPRTPAGFLPLLEEVRLSLPAVVMDGAALYDMQTKTYLYVKTLPPPVLTAVGEALARFGVGGFVYAVIHDVLHVYYGELHNPAERAMLRRLRGNPHKNYVFGRLPEGHDASMVLVVDTAAMIRRLEKALAGLSCADAFRTVTAPSADQEGYLCLRLYPARATPAEAVQELKRRSGAGRTVGIGCRAEDAPLVAAADISYAASEADDTVLAEAGHRLRQGDGAAVKVIERLFFRGLEPAERE